MSCPLRGAIPSPASSALRAFPDFFRGTAWALGLLLAPRQAKAVLTEKYDEGRRAKAIVRAVRGALCGRVVRAPDASRRGSHRTTGHRAWPVRSPVET